ncbi:MAG: 16S rRNA (cytidine(1402)-2'-O)-methyltransferase [Proteobacteria bacterium]|nr:16S rRNA (cytidine(1402)-2'-O)-methyltransferase [Pseudomonadota bacterium]
MRPDSPLPPPDFPGLLFWSSSILSLPAASASLFRTALQAARDAAGSQDYPQGTLYVVATPIGNLADVTLRALHVLDMADAIACEDTRHTQSMLRAYGIDRKGGTQLLAVHQHNEAEAAQAVIGRLAQGERIAYVSDAGTPGVSDPGARLAAAVRAAGHRVLPLPGASSVTTLISAAGLVAADADDYSAFVFTGFLPSKATERDGAVGRLAAEPRAVVLLEAPHRIEALARALAVLGARRITVGRELTKQFEEIDTVPCDGLAAWLGAKEQRTRGEFALVLHPAAGEGAAGADEGERVLRLLLPELPLKGAVRLAAEITGAPRNALYDLALRIKQAQEQDD